MTASVAEAVATLGARSARLTWSETPESVRDRTLLVVFDTLGVMMAGAATPEVQALADRHPETGAAPLAGLERWGSALDSCWVNGAAVCSLELDEGSKYARGHPAAHVIPAALASGDQDGTSWLGAVLVGYEVAARFGRATRLHRGVHPHGTWGATGAAAAAARLAGLDADGVAAAIDAATGLSLAPHFESAFKGHPVRNLWVGAANAAGLEAARLADAGIDRVDGTAANTYGDLIGTFDPAPLTVPFEERFEVMGGYFKRHAACAYTHSAADAILRLLEQEPPLPVEEVDSVTVETYQIASTLDRLEWPSRLAAMFSVPFVVAVALLEGAFGPGATDEAHRSDPVVHDLAGRVAVVATDEFERRLPERRGARVSVRMRDGSRRSAEVEQPVGDSSNQPFGWDEVRAKLTGLIGTERVAELEGTLRDLEGQPVGPLLLAVTRS
ncbi:MAG: MmgE/PrpD family protein [Acidimicrobiia bacterium]